MIVLVSCGLVNSPNGLSTCGSGTTLLVFWFLRLSVLNIAVSVGTSVWWSFQILLLENSIFWNVTYSGGNLINFSHTSQ